MALGLVITFQLSHLCCHVRCQVAINTLQLLDADLSVLALCWSQLVLNSFQLAFRLLSTRASLLTVVESLWFL
jgi:hypothetical protein